MRLSGMLRSGKPLKVYTFQDRDLQKFKDVAKQYGVLYAVLTTVAKKPFLQPFFRFTVQCSFSKPEGN